MSDELHPPGPAWRQPRPSGLDADLRRMLLMAGGLGVALAVGVGGWSVLGHHHGGVPVIEAPSGPVRVRPDNPGGMQVSGLTDPAMVGDGSDGGTLAPPPETPDPQRLRAEVQGGQAPPAAAGPPVGAPDTPVMPLVAATPGVAAQGAPAGVAAGGSGPGLAGPGVTGSGVTGSGAPGPSVAGRGAATPGVAESSSGTGVTTAAPLARLPAAAGSDLAPAPHARIGTTVTHDAAAVPPASARAASLPAATPPAATPPIAAAHAATGQAAGQPATGGVQVQLAAMDSQPGATTEWDRLSHRMPELLEGRHPDIQRVERDGRTLYRVRLDGFGDMAQAIGFCAKVRAKGGGCSIVAF